MNYNEILLVQLLVCKIDGTIGCSLLSLIQSFQFSSPSFPGPLGIPFVIGKPSGMGGMTAEEIFNVQKLPPPVPSIRFQPMCPNAYNPRKLTLKSFGLRGATVLSFFFSFLLMKEQLVKPATCSPGIPRKATHNTSLHKNHPGRRTAMMTAPFFFHRSSALNALCSPWKEAMK